MDRFRGFAQGKIPKNFQIVFLKNVMKFSIVCRFKFDHGFSSFQDIFSESTQIGSLDLYGDVNFCKSKIARKPSNTLNTYQLR